MNFTAIVDKILNLAERYVMAQEVIAAGIINKRPCHDKPEPLDSSVTQVDPAPEPVTAPISPSEDDGPNLEELRAMCTAAGIKFRSTATRTTLIKKLEKAKTIVKENEDKLITLEECREVAKKYHLIDDEKYNAIALIKEVTTVGSLSEVAEWEDEKKKNEAYAKVYSQAKLGLEEAKKQGLKLKGGKEI